MTLLLEEHGAPCGHEHELVHAPLDGLGLGAHVLDWRAATLRPWPPSLHRHESRPTHRHLGATAYGA